MSERGGGESGGAAISTGVSSRGVVASDRSITNCQAIAGGSTPGGPTYGEALWLEQWQVRVPS